MAQLTAKQWTAKMRNQLKKIQEGIPLAIAAQSIHADRMVRIFDTGSVSRGYNKTKEIWIENKLVRGGATNSGKTGRAKKTSYFKSYFDAKGKMGFNNSHVNFRLTNDLQMDLANSQINPDTGKVNVGKVIKVSPLLYVEKLRRETNQDKLKGLIKRFGDFTRFTQGERDKFDKIIFKETVKLLEA